MVKYLRYNRLFLIILLFLFCFALYYIHSLVDQPHIISSKKIDGILLQQFFYNILISVCYFFVIYSIFSPIFFWVYFYYLSIKLDLIDYCLDLFVALFWFVFVFILVTSFFYCDSLIATLNVLSANFDNPPNSEANLIDIVNNFLQKKTDLVEPENKVSVVATSPKTSPTSLDKNEGDEGKLPIWHSGSGSKQTVYAGFDPKTGEAHGCFNIKALLEQQQSKLQAAYEKKKQSGDAGFIDQLNTTMKLKSLHKLEKTLTNFLGENYCFGVPKDKYPRSAAGGGSA